ncbi:MAG: hypothetical protein JXR61_00395 [Prolixibacteraceae bacterium]|nr:hypothetical protein [Prolixibacteraceae bacterium]
MKNTNIPALNSKILKITLLISFALALGITVSAQIVEKSGINIGVNAGGAKLTSEFVNNKSIQEFSNNPGFTAGFEISKIMFQHIEIGTVFSHTKLSGETDQTNHFSAIGHHYAFMEPITGPTEYINKLTGQNFFVRYYFNEAFKKSALNPFVKIDFGFLSYKSTFRYVGGEDIIFGKGDENQPKLNTGMLALGTGFKTNLSKQLYLVASLDFNLVKYDFLDVVHNYDTDGNRMNNTTGLYSEFKIGVFYSSAKSEIRSGAHGKRKNGKNGKNNSDLPFAR